MNDYRDDEEHGIELLKEAERLHERGIDFCYVLNDYDKAVTEMRKAVALRESILGKYNNDTALSYFRLLSILSEYKSEYKEALMIARRELRITQLVLDIPLPGRRSASSNNSTTGSNASSKTSGVLPARISWISKAFQQIHGKSKSQAKEYCSKLLSTIELERVGDVYFAEHHYEKAITKYDFALTLESSAFARNSLDMADLNVKIGDCWFEIQEFEKAKEEYEIAKTRYQKIFGEYHSTVANVLCKSAAVYLKGQRFDDALSNYAIAFSIYEKMFGKRHAISNETLQDIRLVTVKEMEYLRQEEEARSREAERTKKLEAKRWYEQGGYHDEFESLEERRPYDYESDDCDSREVEDWDYRQVLE